MTTVDDFRNDVENQWCPGCPNFGILTALKRALVQRDLAPHEVCLVSGIGQAAKLPHYLECHFFNGLHGRAVPAATGIKAAMPELTTLVTSGDGCIYGEGGNHLLAAFRRNPDITVIAHDNRIYALTKGQASPMTPRGEKTRLQFDGVQSDPAQMLATAIVHGCGFVARGYAGDIEGLTEILSRAIAYRGLALVDVIQPCITWGHHPVSWYEERVVSIPADHDCTDSAAALEWACEIPDRFPVGVLYERPLRPVFGEAYGRQTDHHALMDLETVDRKKLEAALQAFAVRAKGA